MNEFSPPGLRIGWYLGAYQTGFQFLLEPEGVIADVQGYRVMQ